ncbi:GGDEF domain-containing protein [Kordiimonas lipolytica]|uniref:diguanylate cyclase n=1 Tax=Kordiimonas lipolytica TaxID=1662421 RepID=A0ABV8UGX6_9PROT|nr:sensor domain-containing diguanylate cyclase [Kordiimonas lipolytica]
MPLELPFFLAGLFCLGCLFIITLYGLIKPGQAGRGKLLLDPDRLPDGVLISGINGKVLAANAIAQRLITNFDPSHDISKLFDGWHRELGDRAQADQVVEAVLASPDIQFSEMLNLKDGRVIERNTRPLDDDGRRIWFLRDITHVQQANNDSAMHQSMVEADAARTAELAEQLYHAKAELEAKQAELRRLANTDSLTGLLNRRRFTARGEETVSAAIDTEIWVIMMDIDHFKRINDTYGHAAGDVAIRDFAGIINNSVSDHGFVGRMGGEEFAAILPGSNMHAAIRLAEDIRRQTAKHQTKWEDEKFRFTTSIGVAQWQPEEITIEPALDRADQALYSAKAYGRNRVVGFEYATA